MNDRLEKGVEAQTAIFGEHMKEAWKKGHINRWLADNCFGDYYTRNGLNGQEREMITFCFLLAQGGCEDQLRGHTAGNFGVGNGKEKLYVEYGWKHNFFSGFHAPITHCNKNYGGR